MNPELLSLFRGLDVRARDGVMGYAWKQAGQRLVTDILRESSAEYVVGGQLEVDIAERDLLFSAQLAGEVFSVASETLQRLVALVELALLRDPPEPQAVGDDHGVDPVGLAQVLVALRELGHEARVEGAELEAARDEVRACGGEVDKKPPYPRQRRLVVSIPQRISCAPMRVARVTISLMKCLDPGTSLADWTSRPTSSPAGS